MIRDRSTIRATASSWKSATWRYIKRHYLRLYLLLIPLFALFYSFIPLAFVDAATWEELPTELRIDELSAGVTRALNAYATPVRLSNVAAWMGYRGRTARSMVDYGNLPPPVDTNYWMGTRSHIELLNDEISFYRRVEDILDSMRHKRLAVSVIKPVFRMRQRPKSKQEPRLYFSVSITARASELRSNKGGPVQWVSQIQGELVCSSGGAFALQFRALDHDWAHPRNDPLKSMGPGDIELRDLAESLCDNPKSVYTERLVRDERRRNSLAGGAVAVPLNARDIGLSYDSLEALTLEHNGRKASLPSRFLSMLYFSTATITTLGFGDITPRTPGARVLVGLEAILGVFLAAGFLGGLADRMAAPERTTESGKRPYQESGSLL